MRHCLVSLLLLFLAAVPRADAYAADEASQHALIDAAVAAFPNEASDTGRVFFLGFAGVGGERVFAEEIKLAANHVGAKFGSSRRSLLLINDRRDLTSRPLATHDNLRYALTTLGHIMDESDVLFLALSSHGSRDWALSVSNGALPLSDLGAEELSAALDEAGIKWRVIVVSACFAGGFIDELRDPYTIVVAAAAADRTSFGCSNERELTYFGEAFYRDALPTAASLRDAFATAEQRVLERETAEGIDEPSQPMAFFGEEIERKLAALE